MTASRALRQPAMPAAVLHLDLLAAAAERLRREGRPVLGGPEADLSRFFDEFGLRQDFLPFVKHYLSSTRVT